MRLQNSPEAFAAQLKEGQYNELRVALLYMLRGFYARIGFARGRYDIAVWREDRPIRHIEVKWDKRAAASGNLYFEVENTRQGRPSGVMDTPADLWCQVIGEGDEGWIIKVPQLRDFLAAHKFRSVNTMGADSNSRGLLVPSGALSAEFCKVRLPTVEEYFGEIFRRGSA